MSRWMWSYGPGVYVEATTNVYLICFRLGWKSIDYRDTKFKRFMGESELDYRRYFSASSSLSPHPDDGHSRRSSCAIKHSLRRLLASNRCSDFHVISLLFFYFSSHPSTAINALMLVLFADIPATVVASLKERRRCCFVLTAVTCRLEEANDFQRRHFHYDRFIINFSLLKKLFLLSA